MSLKPDIPEEFYDGMDSASERDLYVCLECGKANFTPGACGHPPPDATPAVGEPAPEHTKCNCLMGAARSAIEVLPRHCPVHGAERVEKSVGHTIWCDSNELQLCSGCSVRKGWDRNGVTGEHTTCMGGAPHEWLPKPCSCGDNDQRRGDRREEE